MFLYIGNLKPLTSPFLKDQDFIFKRPIKILQIFTNILRYTKEDKSFDKRKERLAWKPVSSANGHVQNGQLFLPQGILQHPAIERCNLITIKDSVAPEFNYMERLENNDCFQLSAARKLGIFKIKQEEELELHLEYSNTYIGDPKRNNMKLGNLLPGQPVEFIINGKIDYYDRTFIDHQYIFQYLGDFKTATVLPERAKPILKEIPTERKLVDMIKPLW